MNDEELTQLITVIGFTILTVCILLASFATIFNFSPRNIQRAIVSNSSVVFIFCTLAISNRLAAHPFEVYSPETGAKIVSGVIWLCALSVLTFMLPAIEKLDRFRDRIVRKSDAE